MKNTVEHSEKNRRFRLSQLLKHAGLQPEAESGDGQPYAKAVADIGKQAHEDATYVLSDHRVIWMQLKVW